MLLHRTARSARDRRPHRGDAWSRASASPLPPTLVLEGAAQPFLMVMVANQAWTAWRPTMKLMAGEGYTTRPPAAKPAAAGGAPHAVGGSSTQASTGSRLPFT